MAPVLLILINYQGNKLGKFSGKATDQDYVVFDEAARNGMNYMFVNQPYSTYGVLYTPTAEDPKTTCYKTRSFCESERGWK